MFHFFDRTQSFEWDNGFRLYGLVRPGVSAEIQIHVATGSIHEGKFTGCGLSHFLEHMLFQGCHGYPGNAVSDEVNRFGGDLNAFTGCDRTCYRMRVPAGKLPEAVKMLAAMVRSPELPEARFQKEKEVILRECERGMDSVGSRLYQRFLKTMFLRHPLRHPVIGYPEKIASVTREMALEYHARRYAPGRTFAVVTGEFDFDALVRVTEEHFASWGPGNLEEPSLSPEPFPAFARSAEVIFPDSLSRLMAGIRLPPAGSREYAALELLFGMLGTGDSSLLSTSLVLEKRLAIGVQNFVFPVGEEALGGILLETEPGKMARAAGALAKELEKAAKGKFSAARMEREKTQQSADAVHDCYEIENIARSLSQAVFYGGTPLAADRRIETMQHLDVDDLRRAAAEFLDASRIVQVTQNSIPSHAGKRSASFPVQLKSEKTDRGEWLIHVPDRTLPMASFSLLLPGGAIFEPSGKHGISALCAALMSAGCRRYPEKVLLTELDRCGADFSAGAGANSLILHLSAPCRKFPAAMKILSEMLASPLFGEKEFLREKEKLSEKLRTRALDPVPAAMDAGAALLYGKHPYACGSRGFPEEIAMLTREEVARFYASRWYPGQLICGFSGDISLPDARKFAEMILAAAPSAKRACRKVPLPRFPGTLQGSAFSLPRAQTVALRLLPGAAITGADSLDALRILQQMENGLSSRLFREIREKRALCYSVGMYFSSGFHPGSIGFYAMTTPEAGEKVLALLEKEIGRIGKGDVPPEEFEAAKRSAILQCGEETGNPESLLESAILERHYGGDPALLLTQTERLTKITREEFLGKLAPFFASPPGVRVLVTPEKKGNAPA